MPVSNFSTWRSRSQALCVHCTKFYRKILQVGVQVHFSPENICGPWILFLVRFMPANGFVQPFAGIISFLSTLVVISLPKRFLGFVHKIKIPLNLRRKRSSGTLWYRYQKDFIFFCQRNYSRPSKAKKLVRKMIIRNSRCCSIYRIQLRQVFHKIILSARFPFFW